MARLPLHNAVRVGEACAAGLAGLGENCGHRVIGVVRKGRPEGEDPLTAATVAALDAYLADQAHSAGVPGWRRPCWPPPAGGSARVASGSW